MSVTHLKEGEVAAVAVNSEPCVQTLQSKI